MNSIASIIIALIMAPALGMAGGMILVFWNTGIELQPLWVRITNFLVLIIFIRLLVSRIYSESEVKINFERIFPAIAGLIIVPIWSGLLSSDPFDFGDTGNATDNMKAFMDICLPYFSLPMNLLFIWKEGVNPIWAKQKPKSEY
ncbi:hypothetical protein D8682_00375 (plasmid) [Buttiauxella sp. 3AFRM03]|uniref:hypothetical protein n=1 Tax=Buttiauxella sp. 3AFRM03 TaxID=2479367 RepID=UPI000EF8393C|nr:hypothetical protein [Buttiauxella sp. 3AFRM03]AYN25569.1 hypothetical protein D8682_00375 [Buttiauxella sp. 3AFRM03]